MTQNPMRNSVERKIHFYRVDIGADGSGRRLPFNPLPALNVIGNLPFDSSDAGRYEVDDAGNALCVTDYKTDPQSNVTVQFGRVRRTGLPQQELGGKITDLNLAPDAGLLEATHVVFFPNNIVGCEYNHYGPRVSSLGNYMHVKSRKVVERATFTPLVREDPIEQLNRLGEIRLFEMRVHPSYTKSIRNVDDSLADAFDANAKVFEEPQAIQVVLRPGDQGRVPALGKLLTPLRNLLRRDGLSPSVERLQIRGKCTDTGRVETIDLLKDQLVSTKRIVRLNDRGRALNPESAFDGVIEAYRELQNDIEEAVGVSS